MGLCRNHAWLCLLYLNFWLMLNHWNGVELKMAADGVGPAAFPILPCPLDRDLRGLCPHCSHPISSGNLRLLGIRAQSQDNIFSNISGPPWMKALGYMMIAVHMIGANQVPTLHPCRRYTSLLKALAQMPDGHLLDHLLCTCSRKKSHLRESVGFLF